MNDWFVYILRCEDQRLYTGITTCIARRLKQHRSGKGAKALRNAASITLVYQVQTDNRAMASRLEYRIKQLTKAQKERLVLNQPSLKVLTQLLSDQKC